MPRLVKKKAVAKRDWSDHPDREKFYLFRFCAENSLIVFSWWKIGLAVSQMTVGQKKRIRWDDRKYYEVELVDVGTEQEMNAKLEEKLKEKKAVGVAEIDVEEEVKMLNKRKKSVKRVVTVQKKTDKKTSSKNKVKKAVKKVEDWSEHPDKDKYYLFYFPDEKEYIVLSWWKIKLTHSTMEKGKTKRMLWTDRTYYNVMLIDSGTEQAMNELLEEKLAEDNRKEEAARKQKDGENDGEKGEANGEEQEDDEGEKEDEEKNDGEEEDEDEKKENVMIDEIENKKKENKEGKKGEVADEEKEVVTIE